MSWEELEVKPPQGEDKQKPLRSDVGRALAQNPLLMDFLVRTVKGGCYTAGSTLDQVAFREGQRALARTLLILGGQFDGKESQ